MIPTRIRPPIRTAGAAVPPSAGDAPYGAERRADHRHREPEHACAPDELLAIHLAAAEIVEQRVLERACLLAAKLVELPQLVAIHRNPFPSSGKWTRTPISTCAAARSCGVRGAEPARKLSRELMQAQSARWRSGSATRSGTAASEPSGRERLGDALDVGAERPVVRRAAPRARAPPRRPRRCRGRAAPVERARPLSPPRRAGARGGGAAGRASSRAAAAASRLPVESSSTESEARKARHVGAAACTSSPASASATLSSGARPAPLVPGWPGWARGRSAARRADARSGLRRGCRPGRARARPHRPRARAQECGSCRSRRSRRRTRARAGCRRRRSAPARGRLPAGRARRRGCRAPG